MVVILAGARGDDLGGVQASSSLTSPKKKWKKVRVSVCCCVGRVVGR